MPGSWKFPRNDRETLEVCSKCCLFLNISHLSRITCRFISCCFRMNLRRISSLRKIHSSHFIWRIFKVDRIFGRILCTLAYGDYLTFLISAVDFTHFKSPSPRFKSSARFLHERDAIKNETDEEKMFSMLSICRSCVGLCTPSPGEWPPKPVMQKSQLDTSKAIEAKNERWRTAPECNYVAKYPRILIVDNFYDISARFATRLS